jgi:ferredoxin
VCPQECILEHKPTDQNSTLPRQLFINPEECIDCAVCVPECPWDAIYPEDEVPPQFAEDVALNRLTAQRPTEFVIPVERLVKRPTADEVEANKRRWGL